MSSTVFGRGDGLMFGENDGIRVLAKETRERQENRNRKDSATSGGEVASVGGVN